MHPNTGEEELNNPLEFLATGFEILLAEVRAHIGVGIALKQRLEFASNEYEKLLAAGSSLSDHSISPSEIAQQIRHIPSLRQDIESGPQIQRAKLALLSYKMSTGNERTRFGTATTGRCPVAHRIQDHEDFEHDFTTPGKQGSLECPFAKLPPNGVSPLANGQGDPIAAEFHQDKLSASSPTAGVQTPQKCPIRFLDRHSPEEIAKYFENHKHEIPRSHEICVKRYQQNEESIRQVDAKYGNLVSMIQGLGVKHKQYLPERDKIEDHDPSTVSRAVERWAEDVSQRSIPATDTAAAENQKDVEEEEHRVSRFEKPLREVRVGESPSRPWGISVPADKEPAPSALQSEDAVDEMHIKSESIRPASAAFVSPHRSPTDPGARKRPEKVSQKISEDWNDSPREKSKEDVKRDGAQISFNGPVFFGYPADQVATLLQSLSLGHMPS